MKTLKKVTGMFLAFCLCICMMTVIAPVSAQAAALAPAKVHIQTGNLYESFIVQHQTEGDYIKIDSTGSKNLVAKVTSRYTGSSDIGESSITVYAKKNGTYNLKYTLYSRADKKVKTFTTKVYANTESAIKKATYAGKTVVGSGYNYSISSPKKSGKLTVTMNSGYKLKKIAVTTYDKDGKSQTKTVKNKSKITLGKYPQKSENITDNENYYYEYTYRSMYIYTTVYVTYVDKYTKEEETTSFSLTQYAI